MGVSSRKPDHARHRAFAHRRPDRAKAPPRLCAGGFAGGLTALFLCVQPATAETLKLATWHVDLSRDGPGLLLRDLLKGEGATIVSAIAEANPDVLLLTDIDYDHDLVALGALADLLEQTGAPYPHRLARRPNAGLPTGVDLDGDGRLGGPRDAQGYGLFSGHGGIAMLSRWPILSVRDFTDLLWRDLPDNLQTPDDPAPELQRLSSANHLAITLETSGTPLTLLTWHATPPVFDGPEDRNGRRNHDELMLWQHYLDGAFGAPPPNPVLIGNANLDPVNGDGLHSAMQQMLADPRLQDPLPGQPTVNWEQTGPMRVSYILPAAGLEVAAARVLPSIDDDLHQMVTVTLSLP